MVIKVYAVFVQSQGSDGVDHPDSLGSHRHHHLTVGAVSKDDLHFRTCRSTVAETPVLDLPRSGSTTISTGTDGYNGVHIVSGQSNNFPMHTVQFSEGKQTGNQIAIAVVHN